MFLVDPLKMQIQSDSRTNSFKEWLSGNIFHITRGEVTFTTLHSSLSGDFFAVHCWALECPRILGDNKDLSNFWQFTVLHSNESESGNMQCGYCGLATACFSVILVPEVTIYGHRY